MAKDLQSKKRKASNTSAAEVDAVKKVKKAASAAPAPQVPAKKRKATEESSPVAVKKTKTPITLPATSTSTSKPKKTAAKDKAASKTTAEVVKPAESAAGAARKSKALKKVEQKEPEPELDEMEVDNEEDEASELSEDDDQTAAFLEGFPALSDDEEEAEGESFTPGAVVPQIPKKSKKEVKQLKKLQEAENAGKPGVVFIGRIPHGFYENEMKAYFSQFGEILNLRLSRNRHTGESKHYGWIQFDSTAVAEIVAKTMDNYLLFKHILKVKVLADAALPENLFKGANRRFKKVPWNKIAGRELAQAATEEVWDKRVEKEEKKRIAKAESLKKLGYEYDAPQLKSAKGLSQKPLLVAAETSGEAVKAIESAPAVEETNRPEEKKGKKAKAVKQTAETVIEQSVTPKEVEVKITEVSTTIPEAASETKLSKKKSKTTLIEKTEKIEVVAADVAVPEKKLVKKASKSTLTEVVDAPKEKSLKKKPSKSALVSEKKPKKKASKSSL